MAVPETPKRRVGKWVSVGAGVAVIAALVVVFGSRFGFDPLVARSPLIGEPVPAITLERLDGGGPISLDELRGDVVVVSFWASWCLPCRTEFPHLNAAARDYADSGVTLVGIVYQESDRAALAFLDEVGWPAEYIHASDPESRAAIEFGVYGIPETFVVGRDGVIKEKLIGGVSRASIRASLSRVLDDT